jgi:hypothetical protein
MLCGAACWTGALGKGASGSTCAEAAATSDKPTTADTPRNTKDPTRFIFDTLAFQRR